MAVATSEASARVGTGLSIMDSSICVATITGLPARRQPRTALLDRGHLFGRQFHARSPRATISASAWAMISSSRSTAEASQLSDDAGAVADPFAASMMSSGPLHEQRDPVGAQRQRRVRSRRSGRERGDRQHHARHVDALAFGQPSAHQHRVSALVASQASTRRRRRRRPAAARRRAPARRRSRGGAGRRARRCRGAGQVRRKRWPGCNCTGPCAKAPTRSLGLAGRPSRRWGGRSRPRSRAGWPCGTA